jgi:hypothetical protein
MYFSIYYILGSGLSLKRQPGIRHWVSYGFRRGKKHETEQITVKDEPDG